MRKKIVKRTIEKSRIGAMPIARDQIVAGTPAARLCKASNAPVTHYVTR